MATMPVHITRHTRPRRRGHAKTMADGTVGVFETNRGTWFGLRDLAADIWSLCDGATGVPEIVAQLAARHPAAPRDRLEQDVRAFLQDLAWRGGVELGPRLPEDITVLFIEPPAADPRHIGKSKEVGLGLSYLCAVLEGRGVGSRILDLRTEPSPWRLLQETLEAVRPRIVGLTATSPAFRAAQFACSIARRVLPDSLILMGGPHVTFLPAETLRRSPEVDVVVMGEAEETILDIVEYYLAERAFDERIAGIAYRVKGEAVVTAPRTAPLDLDGLPFPDPIRFTLSVPRYEELRIMGSRGCPFRCTFCSVSALSQGSLRRRSPASIVDEIEWKHRTYDVRYFNFSDNLFVTNGRHERRICDEILHRGLEIEWSCNCRVDLGDSELFGLMHRSGCRRVFVGLESGDENILRQAAKRLGPAKLREGVRCLQRAGIQVSGGFILGLPGETPATFAETLELARHLRCDEYAFTFFCPLPGTEIYDNFARYGYRYTGSSEAFSVCRPVVETDQFTREDLLDAYITANLTLRMGRSEERPHEDARDATVEAPVA